MPVKTIAKKFTKGAKKPRAIGDRLSFQFSDGGRKDAGFCKPGADCVIRSIAIGANRPYKEVYDKVVEMSANYENDLLRPEAIKKIRSLSPEKSGIFQGVMDLYMKKEFNALRTDEKRRLDKFPEKGTFIVRQKAPNAGAHHYHISVIKDGVMFDTKDTRYRMNHRGERIGKNPVMTVSHFEIGRIPKNTK